MSSASVRFGTKAYVCARYFLRPGKCFKYIDQRGEDTTEHVYEVMALYPYCVLLRDTRHGVMTCPGYNTLSLMLRGSGVNEQKQRHFHYVHKRRKIESLKLLADTVESQMEEVK